MPESCFNLLTEPIFTVERPSGERDQLNLSEVLAALGTGERIEFAALQAHQMHAWYAFLVQLAAIAVNSAGESSVRQSPDHWRALLRSLTPEGDEAWCLAVTDLGKPAFMQPPVPEGSISNWKNSSTCSDAIDLLVTAKNHDVKGLRMRRPTPEHWAFALLSLQTMDGFAGRSNYGVARMNGGYGNRACVAMASDAHWDARFRRDVTLLLDERSDILTRGFAPHDGHRLLWLEPWDGDSSLAISRCDPFFIEICRRIRLTLAEGRIIARWLGTNCRRVNAEERKGDLGDPWTPIRRKDGAALTAKGLGYDQLQQVLFSPDWSQSVASVPRPEDGATPVLVAQILARGQGGTEGWHERLLPMPSKARRLLATPDGRGRIGALARQRTELVSTVKLKVLSPALHALTDNGVRFLRTLDDRVDHFFFEKLFDDVDREPQEAADNFATRVVGEARLILRQAITSVPLASATRYRAITSAERIFEGCARKRLPDIFAVKGDRQDDLPAQT